MKIHSIESNIAYINQMLFKQCVLNAISLLSLNLKLQ